MMLGWSRVDMMSTSFREPKAIRCAQACVAIGGEQRVHQTREVVRKGLSPPFSDPHKEFWEPTTVECVTSRHQFLQEHHQCPHIGLCTTRQTVAHFGTEVVRAADHVLRHLPGAIQVVGHAEVPHLDDCSIAQRAAMSGIVWVRGWVGGGGGGENPPPPNKTDSKLPEKEGRQLFLGKRSDHF